MQVRLLLSEKSWQIADFSANSQLHKINFEHQRIVFNGKSLLTVRLDGAEKTLTNMFYTTCWYFFFYHIIVSTIYEVGNQSVVIRLISLHLSIKLRNSVQTNRCKVLNNPTMHLPFPSSVSDTKILVNRCVAVSILGCLGMSH